MLWGPISLSNDREICYGARKVSVITVTYIMEIE